MLEHMMPDNRSSERKLLYNMKGSTSSTRGPHSPSSPGGGGGGQQSRRTSGVGAVTTTGASNTPAGSPRGTPFSVGQPHPPKLSPSRGLGMGTSSATATATVVDMRTPSPNYFGLHVEGVPTSGGAMADARESAPLARDSWPSPQGASASSMRSFAAAIPIPLPLDANPEFEAFRRQADARWAAGGRQPFSHIGTPMRAQHHHQGHHLSLPSAALASTPSAMQRPRPARWHTAATTDSVEMKDAAPAGTTSAKGQSSRMDVDAASLHDSAYVSSAGSKRNSEASMNVPSVPQRFASPAQMDSPSESLVAQQKATGTSIAKADDRHHHLSFDAGPSGAASQTPAVGPRADSLPVKLDTSGPTMLPPSELKLLLDAADRGGVEAMDEDSRGLAAASSDVLVLDIRVSPQYAQSRVPGALNLCIPTTLLKRATFNLAKLSTTFQSEADKERFARWGVAKCIVVYDAHASDKRDAQSASNMLNKFTKEGYKGPTFILKGGFNAFAKAFPVLVDSSPVMHGSPSLSAGPGGVLGHGAQQSRPGLSLGLGLSVAGGLGGSGAGAGAGGLPVIGGVVLPVTKNAANPFFANVRQNMDLADGVGQLALGLPPGLDADKLPPWLRTAASTVDGGKLVADKFLKIELAEQTRMNHAYGIFTNPAPATTTAGVFGPLEAGNTTGASVTGARPKPGHHAHSHSNPHNHSHHHHLHHHHHKPTAVQLSGLEKGGKNRYKDILPFEHARVVLKGKAEGACDYVNASHVQARGSNKRYIAAQGPLPATFEDFWSVVWDQDVRVIVMLTAESEGGQTKCHPYWKAKDYGPIRLKLLSEVKVSLDMDKHRSSSTTAASVVSQSQSGSLSPAATSSNMPSMAAAQDAGRRRANTTTTVPTPSAASAARSVASSRGGGATTSFTGPAQDDGILSGAAPTNNNNNNNSSLSSALDAPPHVIMRKFALAHTSQPFAPFREVTHLHYSAWPDFGAPARARDILALVELANVMQRAAGPVETRSVVGSAAAQGQQAQQGVRSDGGAASTRAASFAAAGDFYFGGVDFAGAGGVNNKAPAATAGGEDNDRPMLVHCSAGCGRTGTFCTVDSVIDMLKRRRAYKAKAARPQPQQEAGTADADGDVLMSDDGYDDAISPLDDGTRPPPAASLDSTLLSPQQSVLSPAAGSASTLSTPSPLVDATGLDLSWLDDDAVDLIEKTVEDFRRQRLSMVQSLRQFVLCYETVIEWIVRTGYHDGTDRPAAVASVASTKKKQQQHALSLDTSAGPDPAAPTRSAGPRTAPPRRESKDLDGFFGR